MSDKSKLGTGYGQIHCVVRELVQDKFSNETWQKILRESGLDEHDHFLVFYRYEDKLTFQLIGAVSKILDLSLEAVLEVFGDYFVSYCLRHGYDKMLKTLGGDMKSFIQNLDSLHSLLAFSYKNIEAPSFRCESHPDGSLMLHYYTTRPRLYPIVIGSVRAVGREIFKQKVDITVLEQSREVIDGGKTQEHTVFKVIVHKGLKNERRSPEGQEERLSSGNMKVAVPTNISAFHLNAGQFCSAFPYHIIFDKYLKIRQCGVMIHKLCPVPIREGMAVTSLFRIIHPKMKLSLANIHKFINAVFLLSVSQDESETEGDNKAVVLKGQMMWLEASHHMIFIGSPRLTSLNELMEMNVYLADIPLYDVTRELVLLNQQRIAEIDIAKKLDETTAALKRTSQALEIEKQKTDVLLYQMLPPKVAHQLKNGRQVEAEKFDQVTILFSDIVTFTNMAAACTPMDIVNMLNNLYHRFDKSTNDHDIYKVETIGDAYMVVSGVPEPSTNHAKSVADFAMDMVQEAATVNSPATGKPLQIRVGVHTGPVVSGVVGMKMPRYCLFGDSVNTASRMESHGVPGRIHVSPTTFRCIRNKGYQLKKRGQIQVKGKGEMTTYFLVGDKNRRVVEPDDDFTSLSVDSDFCSDCEEVTSSEKSMTPNSDVNEMPIISTKLRRWSKMRDQQSSTCDIS
ncbi:guanylate cyclase soluble subunit beta-2-like [Haliotis rufescens]|uniref:guanylate cyclase soluble subunit beta-2-like n=1 Tax=Haliotis rufescens TaxID=6454 RepID=UPI00201F63BE|nr:guanylate cyclase soluble subunit beta-2-like [Haliotis rufescens]